MQFRIFLVLTAVVACSSANDDAGTAASGGAPSGSGGAITGGATNAGTGGGQSSGGGVTPSNGGVPTNGGATTTGGASSSGGAPSSGGTAMGGGAPANGGASANGGVPASGGTTNTGGISATGGTGGTGGTSACGIPTHTGSTPLATLMLTGNLGTHDPSVIFANGVYYQYATGNGIGAKTSTDLHAWRATPDVFQSIPGWVASKVSGVTNIWAPDISQFGGKYHLYYAVSTFGSNKSCIGHATRDDLGSGSWTDHGAVMCSNVGTTDDFNAIDPNVVVDDAGAAWLAFGSFWSGIKLIALDADGNRSGTDVLALAKHSSIEGPFIVHQCGYYYLFVSFGSCCSSPYDYNVRVGRSTKVTGPYVDKAGTNMMNNGGTLVVQGNATWTAPGHNAVLVTQTGAFNVYHALDANHGNATLRISELALDADGWPVSGGP